MRALIAVKKTLFFKIQVLTKADIAVYYPRTHELYSIGG